ncbi:MAG TPA: PEGA domain-containing protein [Anaeromyxobacteraceae bacterium]|nr:PEGA domain-containing protein [Anaeromyxobacteraceae bacterium]
MSPLLPLAAALLYVAEPAPATPVAPEAAKGGEAAASAPAATPEPKGAAAPAPGAPPAADAKASPAAAQIAPQVALAVVTLDAPTELALLGRSLSEAIAQEAAKVPGVRLLPPTEVVAKLGDAAAAVAAHCGEAAACLAGSGRQLGADRVVGGWIDRGGASYKFGLVLVDVKAGTALARAAREVPIASRRIRGDVVAAAGPLLRGEAAVTGLLSLRTEEPGADVRIDDKPAGKTPLEARLPAGKHKVEVTQRGKVRVEPFWVEVPANGRAEPQVRLYDIPVAERKAGEVETTTFEMGKSKRKK